MNAQNEWMDTDGWKKWIQNKQVDSDYHEFSHAEKLTSLKHGRGMNGRSVRPEPRERVSHLMSHPCFFFFVCFFAFVFIISLQAHGFIFGWETEEKKSHRISASDGVRGGATAAAPVNH